MPQGKAILERLRNPSVIFSIAAQLVTILTLLKVPGDANLIAGIVTASCSILVMLGILSNPTTKNKGYGDDILHCEGCGANSEHVEVAGQMYCKECGTLYTDTSTVSDNTTEGMTEQSDNQSA